MGCMILAVSDKIQPNFPLRFKGAAHKMEKSKQPAKEGRVPVVNYDERFVSDETASAEEKARAFIARESAQFPPLGYSTYLKPAAEKDGAWRVTGWRCDTCD